MKINKYVLFLITLLFMTSCNQQINKAESKNSNEIETTSDTISSDNLRKEEENNNSLNNVIFKKDTLKNTTKVQYEIIETKEKVLYFENSENYQKLKKFVFDNKVNLKIVKGEKNIFEIKISKVDFKKYIPSGLDDYQFSIFNIEKLTDNEIVFFVNICKPETDNCYTFNYKVKNNNEIEIKEVFYKDEENEE